jgi:hypothetical protein
VTAGRRLSVVAGVSLVYDLGIGIAMLLATDRLARLFGSPVPDPILFARLNGLFLVAVGLGYVQPLRRPLEHRAYMWIFGVLLKGAGALMFVLDVVVNASPISFLLFAVTDGALAVVTVHALRGQRAAGKGQRGGEREEGRGKREEEEGRVKRPAGAGV